MDKMNLLEIMHYKIDYDTFAKSWSIYGMPVELKFNRDECLKNMKSLESKFNDDLTYSQ